MEKNIVAKKIKKSEILMIKIFVVCLDEISASQPVEGDIIHQHKDFRNVNTFVFRIFVSMQFANFL